MEPWKVIVAIRYAAPVLTLLYFLIASTVSVCTLPSVSLKVKDQRVRRDVILYLMLGVLCEYMIQALLLLVRSFVRTDWIVSQDEVVYLVSSGFVWGVQLLAFLDSEFPVWHPYYVNWTLTSLFDIFLLVASASLQNPVEVFDAISISIQCLRACNLLVLLCLYLALCGRRAVYDSNDTERQSLLGVRVILESSTSAESNQNANNYGTTTDASTDESRKKAEEEEARKSDEEGNRYLRDQREDEERIAKRLKKDGNWWTYAKAFIIFIPYIWPVHSKALQFRAVLVGVCLLTSNWLNLLIPRQLGAVTDALVAGNSTKAWFAVAIYAALTFANSGACIGWLQFWLWLPLEQYSYNALYTASHHHVMNLSADFHETRDATYIHHSMIRGGSIRPLTEKLIFKLIPMCIDLFLVFIYLFYLFGAYIALILAATAFFYLYTTAKLTSMSAAHRRTFIVYNHKEWYSSYNSVENWRTASYFNNIPHEHNQHCANIKERLVTEKVYDMSIQMITVVQRLIMTLGLLAACFLAVYQVVHKTRSPGDFVVLLTYWAQLQGPLIFFSSIYKQVSEGLMDAERMLSIFQTKQSVDENKDAKALELVKGEVKFNNVNFAYDERKEVLKSINFQVVGGSTVAIVGETGSGKSTILRLLHRFYDVEDGSIEIDGQDIRSVTLKSLRDVIAVVPQDPTLFNDTIMNNVKYAKLNATDEEVYEACKSAAIHEKIMSFPDKYQTKVGKNGIKLSGGEGQRVAIARAILKKAQIILLDEATSAVDTETEQSIQDAFKKLCHGRTTIIIAHRLSTIKGVDRILVMKDGMIIEGGSHDDLIRSKGKYYALWGKQILSDPVAKPSRPRSKSPHKDRASVVNDPDLEINNTELSQILEETTDDLQKGDHKVVEDCDSTKAPKLKPDAPEFYPRHFRASTEATRDPTKVETKEETKDKLKRERDQKKQEKEVRKSQAALVKKAAKNVSNLVGQFSDVGDSSDAQQSKALGSSQDSTTSGTDSKDDKARVKRPKFNNCHHQAKSEPAGVVPESVDGTIDSEDLMASSSGDGQPLSIQVQNQRVSAPNDPSNGQKGMRSSSLGVRPQHPRHWRTRGRRGDGWGSASISGTANYLETSNDESNHPGPPTTSPAEGVRSAAIGFAPSSK